MTSLEKKTFLITKACERVKLIEAQMLVIRSEMEMAIIELRALQQQLQILPPLPVDT